MKKFFYILLLILFLANSSFASQSSITESEGYACLSEDRIKRQTEETALQDAKRRAIEQISTYIQSETEIKDFELKKDIVNAYAKAKVRVIELSGKWDKEPPAIGDCYRIKIKAMYVIKDLACRLLNTKGRQMPVTAKPQTIPDFPVAVK